MGLPEKSGHLFDLGGNISQEPRMSERREEEEELVGEGEERKILADVLSHHHL